MRVPRRGDVLYAWCDERCVNLLSVTNGHGSLENKLGFALRGGFDK